MAISHGHCQSKNKTYDNEILCVSKPKNPAERRARTGYSILSKIRQLP